MWLLPERQAQREGGKGLPGRPLPSWGVESSDGSATVERLFPSLVPMRSGPFTSYAHPPAFFPASSEEEEPPCLESAGGDAISSNGSCVRRACSAPSLGRALPCGVRLVLGSSGSPGCPRGAGFRTKGLAED